MKAGEFNPKLRVTTTFLFNNTSLKPEGSFCKFPHTSGYRKMFRMLGNEVRLLLKNEILLINKQILFPPTDAFTCFAKRSAHMKIAMEISLCL